MLFFKTLIFTMIKMPMYVSIVSLVHIGQRYKGGWAGSAKGIAQEGC